jgi:tetratricopeptide (TPR) repeat protein
MMTTRRAALSSLAAIVALAWCGQAAAQGAGDDEARAQFDTGVELYEQGKFEQAAVAFARAYELKPTYKLRYNIGQVENELGHYANALDAYTLYLAEGGEEIERARQDQVTAEIARLRTLVGMIEIRGAPDGATVFLDDRRSGTTPLPGPLFVDLGEHSIVVKSGADELHREVVKVAGGQRVELKVESAKAGASPVAAAEGAGAGGGTGPAAADRPRSKRVWTWVAGGVGVAAGIGAAITGALTLSKADDATADCVGDVCPTTARADVDSARALGNATNALIAAAAVGVAAGVVLFFVEPRMGRSEEAVEVAAVAAPTAGGAALAVAGRF